MRLYTEGESPDGGQLPGNAVCLEWAGRIGHPSSYGLLGGWRNETGGVVAAEDGKRFKRALPGGTDKVFFGLPHEYREAVEQVQRASSGVVFAVAAHGELGSSFVVFRWLALALAATLNDSRLLSEDALLWREWDRLRTG